MYCRNALGYFLIATVLAFGCGKNQEANQDSLTGKVTVNGQPVKTTVITVTGPDGKPSGGTTNDEGVYLIPNPPKGELKFTFVPSGPKSGIPDKYTRPNNDLKFTYTGGKQTYDIDLK